jgi:hypothetical protein
MIYVCCYCLKQEVELDQTCRAREEDEKVVQIFGHDAGNLCVNGGDNIDINLKFFVWRCELDSSRSR